MRKMLMRIWNKFLNNLSKTELDKGYVHLDGNWENKSILKVSTIGGRQQYGDRPSWQEK